MAEAGILREDDRVELIEGEIVQLPPTGGIHRGVVDRLTRAFTRALDSDEVYFSIQNPVRLGQYSEPQPDFLVLKLRAEFIPDGHPGPGDVFLLIEVSDSTLRYDQRVKIPLYARASIPEVWIVDIDARTVQVYRQPSSGQYTVEESFRPGDLLAPQAFPNVRVPVAEILGPGA
jgi:Uma2 family endonuclease